MHRNLIVLGLSILVSIATASRSSSSGTVHVSGYTTKNGTVVQPYYRRAPGSATGTYTTPSTSASSYSSCADARAAGRWNILRTDADYSSALDRDGDGVACEAGSNGTSIGQGDGSTNPQAGSTTPPATAPGTPTAMTYPLQLAERLGWIGDANACAVIAKKRLDAFNSSTSMVDPVYLSTDAYSDLQLTPSVEQPAIDRASAGMATTMVAWKTTDGTSAEKVTVLDEPGIIYVTEIIDGVHASSICISAYGTRG